MAKAFEIQQIQMELMEELAHKHSGRFRLSVCLQLLVHYLGNDDGLSEVLGWHL